MLFRSSRRYNGGALLGLRGLVFKSHGSADAFAFESALNRAYDAARNNLLAQVRERIAHAAPLLAGMQTGASELSEDKLVHDSEPAQLAARSPALSLH